MGSHRPPAWTPTPHGPEVLEPGPARPTLPRSPRTDERPARQGQTAIPPDGCSLSQHDCGSSRWVRPGSDLKSWEHWGGAPRGDGGAPAGAICPHEAPAATVPTTRFVLFSSMFDPNSGRASGAITQKRPEQESPGAGFLFTPSECTTGQHPWTQNGRCPVFVNSRL